MKKVFIFPTFFWSKDLIVDYFKPFGYIIKSSVLRISGNYIFLIDLQNIDYKILTSDFTVEILFYNENGELQSEAIALENNSCRKFNILKKIEDSHFSYGDEIRGFDFLPIGNSDFITLISRIKNSRAGNIKQIFLDSQDFEKILETESIDNHIKKLIVDTFALIASYLELVTVFFVEDSLNKRLDGLIQNYTGIITCTFVSRIMFEKIVQIIAIQDPALDYKTLQSSKSLKRTFRKMASKSINQNTIELSHYISNLELLDDNYRNPEAHKLGRILSLLNSGDKKTHESLFNEVTTHFNWAMNFFWKICVELQKNTARTDL